MPAAPLARPMREVTVERTVEASPPAVERRLTPTALVEYEGSFAVRDVREAEDGATLVRAGGGGLAFTLRFEERPDGLRYTQATDAGPFAAMETDATVTPAVDGSTVRLRSAVSLGLPPAALVDRIAAWKRRGELERALDRLAADLPGGRA
jgi:hypothetical protein